ncbi:MAG: hypothetical protein CMG71_00980 [Candidatus Marinimicrobia bacterium]|nr:hypothetical protein [Candidatus Neomarinimicrobiota bacterium]|tara:strand:+ start:67100 stop:68323 length:1224 start_codon:yes stop_codon:yes gene_type:complete
MIIFFIHRFNDIDHLTPIIYKIAKETQEKVLVLSLNPFLEINKDFRLLYLIDETDVDIDILYNKYFPKFFYRIIGLFWGTGGGKILLVLRKTIISLFRLDISSVIARLYNDKWVMDFFAAIKPKLLVFDHAIRPGIYNATSLLAIAKNLSIPTVDLPHGISLYIRHPNAWDKARFNLVNYRKDHMVLQTQWWKDELVEHGLDLRNVSILGSARFCDEWTNILHDIIPPERSLSSRGLDKLKVVYMEVAAVNDVKINLIEEMIGKISSLDFVSLIIKPQTRGGKTFFSLPDNIYVAKNENSVNLIKWADVVIVVFTSILIEALIQKKSLIYPRYLHNRETIYEKFNSCWDVGSYDELESALYKLKDEPTYRPYSDSSVEDFMDAVVNNGPSRRDVLDGYKNFLLNIAN